MIHITVNNEELSLGEAINIESLLELQNVESPDMVSVQYNGQILNRDDFSKVILSDGDTINFLYFMGGGSL